jgi:hypothetical protein
MDAFDWLDYVLLGVATVLLIWIVVVIVEGRKKQ